MTHIKIVGVPEHFNMPWYLALQEGAFQKAGLDLEWQDIPEGTGRMCELLRQEETDLAIILTEGIVRDIQQGNPSEIIQNYVSSPLLWGIHTSAISGINNISDLNEKRISISRYGSGSHLMSYLLAEARGWKIEELHFVVVHTLEGAIKSLSTGESNLFLWERFTTQSAIDSGRLKRIGEIPTPWPAFVIAVRSSFLKKEKPAVQAVLRIINYYTEEFKQIPSIDRTLSHRFGIRIELVREWLSLVEWSQDPPDPMELMNVKNKLVSLQLLEI